MKQDNAYGLNWTPSIGRYSFLAEISSILDSGDRSNNLIVAIYLLEQKRFFYNNRAFQRLLGYKLPQFHERGWDFWFANMWSEEALLIKNKVNDFLTVPFDQKLLALRYHIYDATGSDICLKHEMVLHRKIELTFVINYLYNVTEKERIEHCLSRITNCNSTPTDPAKLISPREEEVLKLIADGYSSKQIADRLFISNHTAISHRKHLIEKFQVKNTAQLIKKASKIMEL
ncbi:response regulator transcription factor [Ulvibacterium marinum]|uniref:LuxR family transcriptional regulator n=1 Tax=Ulvibacterium marinum TaxID=2419782 RepID=A0A3B0C7I5_9FLAO|nr:LuxR family transcriptional regulator [Ulvibacterium marinum]RKN79357.1 LuxR family transcriptional regulator [Ulvibacterium marinum]